MIKNNGGNYRWYILILASLTYTFACAMPWISMSVLFKEISEDLDLNLVQIGTVWGMVSLAGILGILIAGGFSDRFGVKRNLTIACILAGLAGATRGLSNSFVTLSATAFLFGFMTSVIPVNVHKTCGIWFPGRQLGLANGVVALGMAAGFTVGAMISATVLSPLLGGWRNVMFLYGTISIVIGILWSLTRSEPGQFESPASHVNAVPFRQALSRVIHIRRVWLLGFIVLGHFGCVQGILGYLPLYLREVGWTAASADGTVAAFNGASMIVTIPLALLSDRLGSRKVILLIVMLVTTIGVGLLSIAGWAMVWTLVIIVGLFRDGFMAVLTTMVMETEGVGAKYAGTAMGLVFASARVGGFFSPPIGNSLASINMGLPFIFWAALAAIALISFYFLKETRGGRGKSIGMEPIG